MAKYNKDTKFYWLQLKEDFFEDDAIEWLEEQKPNGRDYAYFYLKLCLKSLKSNGILIRKVGNILIPYDNEKLAKLTKMDFDTVTVAMELLKKIGLIQILENGEIYINQLENLIGSKSIGAFKKQQQRLLSGHRVDNCPPKIETDIEIETDTEIDVDNEIKALQCNIEVTKCNDNKEKEKDKNKDKQIIETIIEIYNKTCTNLSKVSKVTDKRKKNINKFLKQFTVEDFEKICLIANKSKFLIGNNDRGWKADFDFLLREDKATAILEGKYNGSNISEKKEEKSFEQEVEDFKRLLDKEGISYED